MTTDVPEAICRHALDEVLTTTGTGVGRLGRGCCDTVALGVSDAADASPM